MDTSYKLHYFDMKGRGELIRLLFAVAGVEYEDIRIKFSDWPALKETMPFKRLPVLEINGKAFAQSTALSKYLADKFGFYGQTSEDRLEIDQVTELVKDFIFHVDRSFAESDPERKAALMKEAVEVHSLTCLTFLEAIIKKSETGLFVGSQLSIADLAVFDILDWVGDKNPGPLKDYPLLQAFKEKISRVDRLSQYLDQRQK